MNVGHTIKGTAWMDSQARVVKLYVETAYGMLSGGLMCRGIDFYLHPFLRVA